MAVSERIDVRRNRARLLEATRKLFASEGVDVSVRDVAREAGVGIATLYRHFPTREDLVDAVLEDAFEAIVAAGERALAQDDPWLGFTGLVEETLALCAGNRGLKDAFETRRGRERAASMRRRIRPLFAAIVERAQLHGSLRADFAAQDLSMLFWGTDGVIELAEEVAPGLWRRHLGFVLDGLRASAASPSPHRPLSEAELRRVEAGENGPRAAEGAARATTREEDTVVRDRDSRQHG